MDTRKVYRCHYRALLKEETDVSSLIGLCRQQAEALISDGSLMTAALYYYGRQLFLYYESVGEELSPECFMDALHPALVPWPQKECLRGWALMYPVFWHIKPQNADQWRRSVPPEGRRGRIAYLHHHSMFEYVYHHFALTQEGLHRGDKYMTVALHEDILFSYFEEPRSSVNEKNSSEESIALQNWLAVDPDNHFIHLSGSEGANFLLLPAYFTLG